MNNEVKVREVPLLDLTRLEPELEAELQEAFTRVLKSGYFILGPEVTAFEGEMAERLGCAAGLGVVDSLQRQLAAAAHLGCRSERVGSVKDASDDAVVVQGEPSPAG